MATPSTPSTPTAPVLEGTGVGVGVEEDDFLAGLPACELGDTDCEACQ